MTRASRPRRRRRARSSCTTIRKRPWLQRTRCGSRRSARGRATTRPPRGSMTTSCAGGRSRRAGAWRCATSRRSSTSPSARPTPRRATSPSARTSAARRWIRTSPPGRSSAPAGSSRRRRSRPTPRRRRSTASPIPRRRARSRKRSDGSRGSRAMATRNLSLRLARSALTAALLLTSAAATATTAATPTSAHPERSAADGGAESNGTATATPAPLAAPPPERTPPTAEESAIAKHSFSEGLRLEAAGDLGPASASFERAYDADPYLAHAGVNAALLRERLGDPDGARALYVRLLEENPGFGPAVRNLVRLSLRRGDLAGAEKEARERLARGPESAPLLDVLLAAARLDEAEEASRKALKLDERNVSAMVNLATAYHRKKRNELAKMVLENARLIDDRDPAVWNRLGFVELSLGNRAQALEDFRTAAALGPDYPEARANYGALLADAEDFQGALTELEVAVRFAPGSAATWLNLGNAYRGT